jgi:hypothetical protein
MPISYGLLFVNILSRRTEGPLHNTNRTAEELETVVIRVRGTRTLWEESRCTCQLPQFKKLSKSAYVSNRIHPGRLFRCCFSWLLALKLSDQHAMHQDLGDYKFGLSDFIRFRSQRNPFLLSESHFGWEYELFAGGPIE